MNHETLDSVGTFLFGLFRVACTLHQVPKPWNHAHHLVIKEKTHIKHLKRKARAENLRKGPELHQAFELALHIPANENRENENDEKSSYQFFLIFLGEKGGIQKG